MRVLPFLFSFLTSALAFTPETFRCISIYGLETNLRNTVCSWKHPAEWYIEKLKGLGFNTLRIPVSVQYLVEGDFHILDEIIAYCDEHHIQIFLDVHRVSNEYQQPNPDQGIKEFDGVSDRDEFMNQIVRVVQRYEFNQSVIALNSWNEYTGTDAAYKHEWDKFFFDTVEASFPGRLIYVATGLNWGGILTGFSLEDLPYADRIIYSVHKYHFSGSGDRRDWDGSFGNAFPPNKTLIGEWGFRDPEDLQFGRDFATYLKEKGFLNQCFWTIAHSGDTGGLWYDDCENLDQTKVDIVRPLLEI